MKKPQAAARFTRSCQLISPRLAAHGGDEKLQHLIERVLWQLVLWRGGVPEVCAHGYAIMKCHTGRVDSHWAPYLVLCPLLPIFAGVAAALLRTAASGGLLLILPKEMNDNCEEEAASVRGAPAKRRKEWEG